MPNSPTPSESSSSSSSSFSGGASGKKPLDPLFRTALRYTVSPREYELLHKYLVSRAPAQVQKRAPKPKRYEAMTGSGTRNGSDYNTASIRAAMRVFVAVYGGFTGWEFITERLLKRKVQASSQATTTPPPTPRANNARIAASFSLILLFHRLLHRFFTRLGASLLETGSEAFRKRNPLISHALTWRLTPAVGAALSGLFLSLTPSSPLRTSVTIYAITRSLEFAYNHLEDTRVLFPSGRRPAWFGSWLLMPVCYGQLLHAFVFDRDCFPSGFGDFILRRSPEYVHPRPPDYPPHLPYPSPTEVVDELATLSRANWPPFVSPILFPNTTTSSAAAAPPSRTSPLSSKAHPLITSPSCALLHPTDPYCTRVHLKYWLRAFPQTLRLLFLIYSALSLLSLPRLLASPLPFAAALSARVLRLSVFITGAVGTSWASVCLAQNLVPPTILPTQRWFLGGLLGGAWACLAGPKERSNFLYCLRLSLDSTWKVGRKRRWWRGVRGGDVLLFAMAVAVSGVVYERGEGRPARAKVLRKALGWVRGWEGEGTGERVVAEDEGKGKAE